MSRTVSSVLAVLALAAIALLAAGAAVLVARTTLAERWIVAELASRGVAPASVRVARIDARGLALEDLTIGAPEAPDLTIAQLDATWSWASLRAGAADTLRVSGLRLRGDVGADGLSFGALDPLRSGAPEAESDDAIGTLPALPAREIALDDAQLELDTLQGPASGAASGSLHSDPDSDLDGRFALILEHPLGRATVQLTLAGPPDALRFDADVADDDRRLSASATGRADLLAGTGEFTWTLAPLEFAPGQLEPATLVPSLARAKLSAVSGRVEAHGNATLGADGALAYRADIALRELSFVLPMARVERVSGTVALRGPPLHTPGDQLVSIALLDLGVPLADGIVAWQLQRDGRIALARTRWGFAGGELSAGEFVVDPGRAPTGAVTLRATDVDLGTLFERIQLEGLTGTGRIAGELPLALRDGAIVVRDGVLRASDAGGTIRYAPAPSVADMAASRPNDLGLAVAAFSNFQYDVLEATLDGDLDGEVDVGLHVRGVNPGFQDGRPVELNLKLEARLADLVRAGQAAYRVPEAVEERLRAYSEDAKP
jgi:hypothetical protein